MKTSRRRSTSAWPAKAAKATVPVNVDMATYKAEFLSHYWEGRLRPRYAYAFGLIDQWARLASVAPGFVNLFTQLPGLQHGSQESRRACRWRGRFPHSRRNVQVMVSQA